MEEVTLLEKSENGLIIALSGDIDLGNAERFYEAVMDEYRAVSADVLFDCEKLNFIDSTTLGTFVKILKTIKQDGHSMKLINLQSKIKKLFLICSLDSIMEIA